MSLLMNWLLPTFTFLGRTRNCLAPVLIAFQVAGIATGTFTSTAPQDLPFASHSKSIQQIKEGAQDLTLDRLVKRNINVGKPDLYRIKLAFGQFLHIVLDAQNTELEITLAGPNQRRILNVNSRKIWPTTLSWISSASGDHMIEVRSLGVKGDEGRYQLKVEKVRKANAQDKFWIAAEKAFAEAEKLRKEWLSESSLKALNKYAEARKHLITINEAREQAYALKSIADIYYTLGQNQRAFDYYSQVLPLIRSTGDRHLEIEALNDLGGISIDVSKKEIAFDYSRQAQALSKQIGFVRGEAQALNNIGGYYSYLLGDKLKALEVFNQSLNLWQTTGDVIGQAQVLMNVGHAHTDLGEIQKALSYFNRALEFWQKARDRRGEAMALTAIGLAQSSLGEMQTAFESHNKAAQLLQTIGDRIGQAVTLNGMAYIFETLGQNDKALGLFNKALQLYRAAGRQSSVAVTMGLIAELYESLGESRKALDYFNQQLTIARLLDNRRMIAYTLIGIGTAFDSLGDKDKALAHYRQALSITESLRDPRGQAYSINSIGYVYERSGQKQKAIDHYKQAVALLRAAEDRAGESLTLHSIARAALDIGDLKEAYNQSTTLLNIIESLRTKVASQELRASYFASVYQHYEQHVDILMRMHQQAPKAGYDAEALEASEKARGRSLLDLLKEVRVDIRQGVDPILLQRERDLQQLLNSKAERQVALLSRNHTEEQAAAIRNEIADLTFEYEDVLAKIRTNSPRYAALTQPGILRFSEIQQALDVDTLLLEYLLGDERSYLWAVTSNSISTYQLPGRANIETAAKKLYRSLTSFNQFPKGQSARQVRLYQEKIETRYSMIAAELSQVLLKPVASRLEAKRLVIVTDGALQYVPFAALPDPANGKQDKNEAQPLILSHEIIALPSLSVLAAHRKEIAGRSAAPKTLAMLADPVYEKDDPRLNSRSAVTRKSSGATFPGTGKNRKQSVIRHLRGQADTDERLHFQRLPSAWREAATIAKLVPEQERKLAFGFEANLSTATSAELSQYRILHFVTHGLIYGAHPQLYGMVLSLVDKEGNPQDGFLRLNEIYNLKLPVDLVVLSACQTALGKEIKGEGLVGLTRGFMYAGAARVVASLWKVDDRASAELMKSFYESLLGRQMRMSEALQAAQVAMWKDPQWKFPYYWAAFVLEGEWK
jgi:CHAT domain-containing protein/tetratricopeptide (TPR) repeat protein